MAPWANIPAPYQMYTLWSSWRSERGYALDLLAAVKPPSQNQLSLHNNYMYLLLWWWQDKNGKETREAGFSLKENPEKEIKDWYSEDKTGTACIWV